MKKTIGQAKPEVLRVLAADCAEADDRYPSWSATEYVRKQGGLAAYTMAGLGLDGWMVLRGGEASIAFCLAAAMIENP
jgi:hypothetical protein